VKTGLKLKQQILSKDKRRWDRQQPESMLRGEEYDKVDSLGYLLSLKRPQALGPYVLDTLFYASKGLEDKYQELYSDLCKEHDNRPGGRRDEDLCRPYECMLVFAEKRKKDFGDELWLSDLRKIRNFVDGLLNQFSDRCVRSYTPIKDGKATRKANAASSTVTKITSEIVLEFESGPTDLDCLSAFPPDYLRDVKASYAHISSAKGRIGTFRTSFPFCMAHETLCSMKSKATGGSVAFSRRAADRVIVHSGLLD
jgi:hypothetical protein